MKSLKALLAISMCLIAGYQASAQFVLFDNFNSYTDGSQIIGQGPTGNTWAQTIGSPTGMIARAVSPGDLAAAVGPTGPSAGYRSLTTMNLGIANANTASTVFFQYRLGATTGNNWNFVITDVNPTDTAGTSEVQFNFDNTQPTFRARSGANFYGLSTDGTAAGRIAEVADATYNVWFEIDNSTDKYKVFMQSDGVAALNNRTQVVADNGTGGLFTFRNSGTAVQPNDLININFGSGNGQTVTTWFDNIYVDVNGANPANPVVPEPGVLALAGAAGLCWLALFRRRA